MRKIWNRIVAVLGGIKKDKLLHFIAGMLIVALLACIKTVAPFTLVFGLVAGVLKEWWDSKNGGSVEHKDVIATWLGAVVMQMLVWLYLLIW